MIKLVCDDNMKMDINYAYSSFLKAIENLQAVGNIVEYKNQKPQEFSSLMLAIATFYTYIQRHSTESEEIYSNSKQIIINTLSSYPELEGLKNTLLIDTL